MRLYPRSLVPKTGRESSAAGKQKGLLHWWQRVGMRHCQEEPLGKRLLVAIASKMLTERPRSLEKRGLAVYGGVLGGR